MKTPSVPPTIYNVPTQKRFARDAESLRANDFFYKYLTEATKAAHTIETMSDIIGEFQRRAPRLMVTKCIDGRIHGSKGKGYPPTTVTFSRTEGNIVDLQSGNHSFWRRINRVVSQAMHESDDKPALFIALGHYAVKGHGCAAHSLNNDLALKTVAEQAKAVQNEYDMSQLYAIHGMTNTDDMSERLIFPNGTILDTAEIIEELKKKNVKLLTPADLFQKTFLSRRIDDEVIDRYVGGLTPEKMLRGTKAPMYNDLQTALAMEAYLIREISKFISSTRHDQDIIIPELFKKIDSILSSVPGLPKTLKPALAYQAIWNIAYTLYQRNRLHSMSATERKLHLEHNEDLIAYGEGFELLSRNKVILVKIGRGNDADALTVARKVILNNRTGVKKSQRHPPLVHANVEIAGLLQNWNAFNINVLSPLRTMLRTMKEVFGNDARILTTYSYENRKVFYPVHTKTAAEMEKVRKHEFSTVDLMSYPIDVAFGLTPRNYNDTTELARREKIYVDMMLS